MILRFYFILEPNVIVFMLEGQPLIIVYTTIQTQMRNVCLNSTTARDLPSNSHRTSHHITSEKEVADIKPQTSVSIAIDIHMIL